MPVPGDSILPPHTDIQNHHQILHMQSQLALVVPGPKDPISVEPVVCPPPFDNSPLSEPSGPVYGPANPYDPYTELGREFIEQRDFGEVPTLVDRFLQANMCLWHQDDPRIISTELMPDNVPCTIEVVHFAENTDDFQDDAHDVPGLVTEEHYALVITAEVPYGWVEPRWSRSPPAILDVVYRENLGGLGPDWCNMFEEGERFTFNQPRSLVASLFAYMALNHENIDKGYSEAIMLWARAISDIRWCNKRLKEKLERRHQERGRQQVAQGDSSQSANAPAPAKRRRVSSPVS
ncbi:uncharacterized protein STEHIDRAFT_126638 [Stereum hirsutum FP-91666 SS1]|uniref:Uncharacterized protein n=1 Tax=Stereum hirsutum (strain FP-91666) TaxID=721885 RepID=R7RXG9_STEHR|nr:uncharacterized protein STEHIDRAFT_126638 [Stereum hirsutum FP-91666 SS1]EIM79057.1 hypothetical protein STEHIDRAFT_126638 [Stereum hirsutum FP-91666 SS1]